MPPIPRFITPAPGFAGELGQWVSALDDIRAVTLDAVRDASIEQLTFKPPGVKNSAGQLLRHIAMVELGWVGCNICGEQEILNGAPPLLQMEGMMTDPGPRPVEEFIAALDYARAMTRQRLAAFKSEDLDTTRVDDSYDMEWILNVRWILYHLVEHEAQHKGQIALLLRMHKHR